MRREARKEGRQEGCWVARTGDNTVDGGIEALIIDDGQMPARGDERRLITHVGDLGTREPGSELGEACRRHSAVELELEGPKVHREDLLAPLHAARTPREGESTGGVRERVRDRGRSCSTATRRTGRRRSARWRPSALQQPAHRTRCICAATARSSHAPWARVRRGRAVTWAYRRRLACRSAPAEGGPHRGHRLGWSPRG